MTDFYPIQVNKLNKLLTDNIAPIYKLELGNNNLNSGFFVNPPKYMMITGRDRLVPWSNI